MRYKNIAGRFFGLVTKHACDRQTDGQTDGQNCDFQDRASIASRGKNKTLSQEAGSLVCALRYSLCHNLMHHLGSQKSSCFSAS